MFRKSLVSDDQINSEGTQDLRLTGVTGYVIRTYGTTLISVGVEPNDLHEEVEMIVSEDMVVVLG